MRLGLRLGTDEYRGHALAALDLEQVVDGDAFGLALALRDLVHAQLEHAPDLSEEEDRRMCMRGEQVLRVVLLARAARRLATGGGPRALQADPAALLRAEDALRLPLHTNTMRVGEHHVPFVHPGLCRPIGS